jgi:hypothetical protein
MTKEFGKLSEFAFRDVEYYRSSDPYNTAIYHAKDRDHHFDADDKLSSAFYELLIFNYNGGDHTIYVKYPHDEYFTEISGGSGGGNGSMTHGGGKNVWKDLKYGNQKVSYFKHDTNLLLSFGEFNSSFNFLTLMGRTCSNTYEYKHSNAQSSFGLGLIKNVLSCDYLKIPQDVRNIAYACKLEKENSYILVDYPAYNFGYMSHDFYFCENGIFEKMKVTNFSRARDGGSTWITLKDKNNVEHEFFYPTSFSTDKDATWDDKKIINIKETEKDLVASFVKMLGIELEPKLEKELKEA